MDIDEQRRSMVGVTARLVEFLRELARTGRPQVRDIEHHQMVRWLSDLPDQITLDAEAGPGEKLVSIDPVPGEPAPVPPPLVARWVEQSDVENSSLERPRLQPGVPDEERAAMRGDYEAWVDTWRVWAEADRRVRPRRDWYEALARAARQLEQQDDFEMVVGTGLITWSAGGHDVRHPLLTTRVEVVTDPASGRIDVVIPEGAGTRLGDRTLLEGIDGFDPTRAEPIRDEVRTLAARPLGDDNKELLTRWHGLALERAHPYEHTWEPSEPGVAGPDLRFAPALILRERDRTSLIDYFDRMLEHLSGPDAVAPVGLAQLLTALEPEDRLAWLEREGADDAATVGGDPLFPLPANPEQRQIVERLRHDNGVAVLGPPGTGKTHTIANLLSALLARGQRVLVTSQKAQALRVLRDKLPPELQQLCVSMTDVRRGGSRELDKSVTALSDRYGTFDRAHHDEKIRRLTAERDAARQDVAALQERIRALRESETYVHPRVAEGYEGTRARIAERLHRHAAACGWMPVPVPDEAPADPPLMVAELAELRRLLASGTPEREARRRQVLPDMATVPTAVFVAGLCAAEAAATAAAREVATELSDALSAVGHGDLASLRAIVDGAAAALHALALGNDEAPDAADWRIRALADGLAHRELAVWQQLAEVSAHARPAQDGLRTIGLRTVSLPEFEPEGPESLVGQLNAARALRAHLAAGSALKRRLRPAVQKAAGRLLDGATVDGAPVTNLELLDVVVATLEAEQVATVLTGHWANVGVALPAGQSLSRRVAQIVDHTTALENVLAVVACRDEVERQLAARSVRISLRSLDEWSTFAGALGAVEARLEAERATAELEELVARLGLDARAPTAAPEIARLAAATRGRDPSAYEQHLEKLAGAFGEQAEQRRCDELWSRLHGAHPPLAELLARTATDPVWGDRITSFPQAWAWGTARTFFDAQREPGLEERLAADLADAVDRVGRTTAALAAEEAWGQCLLRMTAHQEQALRAYRARIEDRGAGTGKWAHRYAAAAREAMIAARDAVPAWVMPLGDVIDTIPPDRNSFDVVIIDEASQASIEALFLLWLAPRVIVVGDERQCAPSLVARGQLQPIFDRLDDYLADVPEYLRLAFTPRSNLFSLLQSRFGTVIRLREHFRCMPEIIGWSSRQFYADAPLVPLRRFGADRLPPLRTVHVTGAVAEGRSSSLSNVAEAEAVVEQVVTCIRDPAYADRDMGVVVLQGSAQARLIEDLLEQRVAPDEWERRRLRVGTPPDFQGDERKVMFLSMVVADRPKAVTSRDWQRRFNVAASRAEDQMWLFHSVTVDLLSVRDLRRSLLAYMLNPPAPLAAERYDDLTWDADRRHPFESKFEQRVFIALRDRGYRVTPQVEVNGRRIDLVVTGAKGQLGVECDGDHWHSRREDQIADLDRELELRRAGWELWRVRESEFYLDPDAALGGLWEALETRGIRPGDLGGDVGVAVEGPTGEVAWEATPLSDEEGLDGLDDDDEVHG